MTAVPAVSLRPTSPADARADAAAARPFEKTKEAFTSFLGRYTEKLATLFEDRADADRLNLERGAPPYLLQRMRETDPLAVYIPEAYGGRGGSVAEGQAVLEATGYESLALTLMVGINGGLFLQPLSKYGEPSVQASAFGGVLREKRLAGLMITEPGFGSDALKMQTSWTRTEGGGYHIEGTKHWGGLTGWADYWLVTARPKRDNGDLRRDIDFFVCDVNAPGQHIEVEELYPNLGLRMLPYGRNRVDITVPAQARLEPQTTGIKMMLDTLHRSRLQFPGMGMGFLRRLYDEALEHCRERMVGSMSLVGYDQVRARLARIQSFVTGCAAMCLNTSENSGIERELSGDGLRANVFKTVVTDWMQEASQSFMQLSGARGYRADHLAGRALVDSRPFQIFEGSNDILYQQVTESVVKSMRRMKETNLGAYLRTEPLTARASEMFGDALSFDVDWQMPQRKLVDLGRALSRIVSMEMTIELGERGYAADLVRNALDETRADVGALLTSFREGGLTALVEDAEAPDWLARVRPAPAV